MIALVILLSFAGFGFCQLAPMFLGPGQGPYEVLLSNVMEPKPVMRYVPEYQPVYNENPVYWNEPENVHRSSEEILHLRRRIDELSQQTMRMQAERIRHAEEINRLRDELKMSLNTAGYLQRGLITHEMELMRLWQTLRARRTETAPKLFEEGVIKELVCVMERLEKLVDNVVTEFKNVKTKMDAPV